MQTFQTPGSLTLRLRVPAGEVEVETVDGAATQVEIIPLRRDEASEAAVEETRIDLRQSGDGHELRVDVPERGATGRLGFLFSRSPEVRVQIRCPREADLLLKSKSADLDARGRFGNVEVETTSGDVEVADVGGSARAQAVSGDVRFGRVDGPAEINTVSGDIAATSVLGTANLNSVSGDIGLREAGSSVNSNSVSGDQRLEAVSEGSVDANSVSGDVYVGVRRGSRVWIDAGSRSGDVTSELEVQDARPDGEGPFVELRVQSLSGDIQLVRAPSPSLRFELKDTDH